MKKRILIVDDEEIFLVQLKAALEAMGMDTFMAKDGLEALERLRKMDFAVVLADMKMPRMDGLELLEKIKKLYPHTYVVMISGHGEVSKVVKAMKLGAYDFLQKPFDLELLEISLRKIFQTQDLIEENISLRKEVEGRYDFHQIVGKNHRMREVYELISLAAETDTTTLITGETGTGKELVAKAIHYNGPRKKKPLITVNCAAIPEPLLQSELFGHEKGSFTGAHTRRLGRFELAHQGTLFLDEIGDIPFSVQGKLLRFLQEKEIRRLGGDKIMRLNVRIISATNQNLAELAKERKFREDLYYRINVLTIHLPPLRERLDDIPLLAEYFLEKYRAVLDRKVNEICPEALDSLFRYHWPGNVRELENEVEKAVLLEKGDTIRRFETLTPSGGNSLSGETSLPLPGDADLPFKQMKAEIIALWEREYLRKVLSRNRGNITRAAKEAELNYKTFYEKFVRYGFSREEFTS